MADTDNGTDLIAILRERRRLIGFITVGIATLAVLTAGAIYFRQARTSVVSVGFRPAFNSAALGLYPNKAPFAATDVISPSIVDAVHEANSLEGMCPRSDFANGFFVDQDSVEMDSLDADYAGRLTDRTLNPTERQRLLDEYRMKRSTQELSFSLRWIRPAACSGVSATVQRKIVSDVLLKWADESMNQRGVLSLPTVTMSPEILDIVEQGAVARLVRIDRIRLILDQAIGTADELAGVPGAQMVRPGGPGGASLGEVRARMRELRYSRLDPLLVEAGPALGAESMRWAETALAMAEQTQRESENRAQSYVLAMREFSDDGGARVNAQDGRNGRPADSAALSVQADRSLIDRFVELSQENVMYRQKLGDAMVSESLQAVEASREVTYLRRLVASLHSGRSSMAPAEVDQRIAAIVTEGKTLLTQLRAIAAEFSRIAFRAAPSIYKIESPVRVEADAAFTSRQLMLIALAAPFAAFVMAVAGVLFVAWARTRVPSFR